MQTEDEVIEEIKTEVRGLREKVGMYNVKVIMTLLFLFLAIAVVALVVDPSSKIVAWGHGGAASLSLALLFIRY